MAKDPISNAYCNLCAAVVSEAVNDVVRYKLELALKPPGERSEKVKTDAISAQEFINDSNRLALFTNYSSHEVNKMIDDKYLMMTSGGCDARRWWK